MSRGARIVGRRGITQYARQRIARRLGCQPGGSVSARCWYCDAPGSIHWHMADNSITGTVTLSGLEFDHIRPVAWKRQAPRNPRLLLACPRCNQRRGDRHTASEWWRIVRGAR